MLGGRAAEDWGEGRVSLSDPRIERGAIPYLVSWCRKCRKEYVLSTRWLSEVSDKGVRSVLPAPVNGVLGSGSEEKSPGPEVR